MHQLWVLQNHYDQFSHNALKIQEIQATFYSYPTILLVLDRNCSS